tara:strand:+ start:22 stop:207 length:186 start_codon:yes stop_codon:yes gene_type:complete
MICKVKGCGKDTEYDVDKWCKEHGRGMCHHCEVPMYVQRDYYEDGDYHEYYVCHECGADYG